MKLLLRTFFISAFLLAAASGEGHALQFSAGGIKIQKKVKSLREIRDHNLIRQTSDYSCGAAGLATLLTHDLHDSITEREVMAGILKTVDLEKVKGRGGFSLLDLKRFAEARGYKATGYKMDFDFLKGLGKTVMVPIQFKEFRHFVIVKGVVDDKVFVADSAMGNMIMKASWFKRIWQDGVGMVIEHPYQSRGPSSLALKREDFVMVDGDTLKRWLGSTAIRTATFPTEF